MTSIRVLVAGDFCPAGALRGFMAGGETGAEAVAGEISALARASDSFIVNLECPISRAIARHRKTGPSLQAPPTSAEFLAALGVRLVTLANNHILDAGQEGLEDTLRACSAAGLESVGAGMSLADAGRPRYLALHGRTLAVVNMAEQEFSCARADRGGANPLDVLGALAAIREARKHAQHVLLIVHGGLESSHFPSPESVRVFRFLASEGCTAILRHHGHSVQGYEVWGEIPIFYGLGNFLFDWPGPVQNEGWHEGILVQLMIDEADRCSFEIVPFEQCRTKSGLTLFQDEAKEAFLRRVAGWSRAIADPAALSREWDRIVESRSRDYRAALAAPHPFVIKAARRLGLLRHLEPSAWTRKVIESYLRCDAHRELLLEILARDDRGGRGL